LALQFLSPIHKASRQIAVYLERDLDERDIASAEGHLLSYLRSYGPCPVGELHRVFGHKRSTLTSILDRLCDRGFVCRRVDPEDRRSVLVELTARGRREADRVQVVLETLEEAIRSRVRARDLEGFRAVMAAIGGVTAVELRMKEE